MRFIGKFRCFGLALALVTQIGWCGQPQDLVRDYLRCLREGRWDQARTCWVRQVIAQSCRLGIEYEGVPAKYDLASPLATALNRLRSGQAEVRLGEGVSFAAGAEVPVTVFTPGDSQSVNYYAVRSSEGWKLTTPLEFFAGNWPIVTSKYGLIHCSDSTLINPFALRELDDFIASTGRILGLDSTALHMLEAAKIEYYLGNDQQVCLLTGFTTQGMADLQQDAVISRQLPHYHELTHLLVNYTLRELPLYTQPFMQEGLAVALGGRWGKSPAVMMQLGSFVLAQGLCSAEDLLTWKGFQQTVGSPDLSYAAAGLLVSYLLDRYGSAKVKSLYLALSGSNEFVQSMTLPEVQQKLATILGDPWASLQEGLRAYLAKFRYSGLRPTEEAIKGQPVRSLTQDSLTLDIISAGDDYLLRLRSAHPGVSGLLLMSADSVSVGPYQSHIFTEQQPGQAYHGEMFGLQMSPGEAGLYNYYTNTLLAKYAVAFDLAPINTPQNNGEICYLLRKSALPADASHLALRLEKLRPKSES